MALVGRADPQLGHALADVLGDADVVVDFTQPDTALDNARAVPRGGRALRDGHDGRRLLAARGRRRGEPFVAPNFAIGAVLMMQFAARSRAHMPECEIIELHHDRRSTRRRGTATRTAELIREAGGNVHEPIHSVRLPGLVAHQEVIFGGPGQTLTIRHDSIARESFMPGVLLAIRKVGASLGRSPSASRAAVRFPARRLAQRPRGRSGCRSARRRSSRSCCRSGARLAAGDELHLVQVALVAALPGDEPDVAGVAQPRAVAARGPPRPPRATRPARSRRRARPTRRSRGPSTSRRSLRRRDADVAGDLDALVGLDAQLLDRRPVAVVALRRDGHERHSTRGRPAYPDSAGIIGPVAIGGVLTAMVTPFDADGRVDEEPSSGCSATWPRNGSRRRGRRRHHRRGADAHRRGETARCSSWRRDEGGDLIVAGTGSNDTAHCVQLTERATGSAWTPCCVVTPYYNRRPARGLRPLRGDRGRDRQADHRLQHPQPRT